MKNPSTNLCLDTLGKDEKSSIPLAVYPCQNGVSANQYLSLSKDDRLRREDTCAVTSDSVKISLSSCSYSDQKQRWKHTKVSFSSWNYSFRSSMFRTVLLCMNPVIVVWMSKALLPTDKFNWNHVRKISLHSNGHSRTTLRKAFHCLPMNEELLRYIPSTSSEQHTDTVVIIHVNLLCLFLFYSAIVFQFISNSETTHNIAFLSLTKVLIPTMS